MFSVLLRRVSPEMTVAVSVSFSRDAMWVDNSCTPKERRRTAVGRSDIGANGGGFKGGAGSDLKMLGVEVRRRVVLAIGDAVGLDRGKEKTFFDNAPAIVVERLFSVPQDKYRVPGRRGYIWNDKATQRRYSAQKLSCRRLGLPS